MVVIYILDYFVSLCCVYSQWRVLHSSNLFFQASTTISSLYHMPFLYWMYYTDAPPPFSSAINDYRQDLQFNFLIEKKRNIHLEVRR
jgi:hypothetical protein